MAISFYDYSTKNMHSFYDNEFVSVESSVANSTTGYYYLVDVAVPTKTFHFKINPHPTNFNALINPMEPIRAIHSKYFLPNISAISDIGTYDLNEYVISASGCTGTTVIETAEHTKQIAHNHQLMAFKTVPYADYVLRLPVSKTFNKIKENEIELNQCSTIYGLNGTINTNGSTNQSDVHYIIYNVTHNDGTWYSYMYAVPSANLNPVENSTQTVSSTANLKIAIPTGSYNINRIYPLYFLESGTTGFDPLTITTGTNTIGAIVDDPIDLNTKHYYVYTVSGTTTGGGTILNWSKTSEAIKYTLKQNCKGTTTYRLAWLNQDGGYDYWNFYGKTDIGYEVEKSEFRANNYTYNQGSHLYTRSYLTRLQTFNDMKGDITYTVSSRSLSNVEMESLKDLYISPNVFLIVNNTAVPIQVTNTSIGFNENNPSYAPKLQVTFNLNEGLRFQI